MDSDECRPMIRKEGSRLYRKSVSGRSEAEFLGVTGDAVPTDVSRDGTFVYSLGTQTAERAIWVVEGLHASENPGDAVTGAPRDVLARWPPARVRIERLRTAWFDELNRLVPVR